MYLKSIEYTIVSFINPVEALDYINKNFANCALVITDCYMPQLSGFELIKKIREKLIIAAMIKGQIQSEVIEDVQAELDKNKDTTIQRTFTFDRDTDIGKIQIGDRYHACVASNDLSPPEGQECEKRLVKNFDKVNSLPAR